jgi:ParB-like chromosome segregation protein Spo0J
LLQTQLAANCLRVDLKPTEKALAYERLLQSRQWSHAELAKAMHISKSTVTQTLSWLSLPDEAKTKLDAGELSGSAAYAISRAGDAAAQRNLLDKAVSGQLTRDDVQREVSRNGNSGRRQRSTFRLECAEIRLHTEGSLDLTGCVELLQQLLRECRKAIKQGLDITTFERVLTDSQRAGA